MKRTLREHLIGLAWGLTVTIGVAAFSYLSAVGEPTDVTAAGLLITVGRSAGTFLSDYFSDASYTQPDA